MGVREADVLREAVSPRLAWSTPGSGVAPWKVAAFYVGVPFVLAFYGTFNNWRLLEHLGHWPTLGFYVAHAVIPWLLTATVTWGLWRLLAGWRPGLVTLTTLGSLVACSLTVGYVNWINEAVCTLFGVGTSVMHVPGADFSVGRVVGSTVRSTAIWVIVNLLCDRYLGYPRYRYREAAAMLDLEAVPPPLADDAPAGAGAIAAQVPAFMQRLSKPVPIDTLLAIHAEQHYIKVIAAGSQQLVLYRMSDAVRELAGVQGVQVHRSWWVSRQGVAGVRGDAKKMNLVLVNGLEVPVSTPYQALARASFAAI